MMADLSLGEPHRPLKSSSLTGVGVRIAVRFCPLVRRGLLVELILRLHQRERMWEERPASHGLMVPQSTVTAAFLRPIRQVKRDAPLRLQSESRETEPSVNACLLVSQSELQILLFVFIIIPKKGWVSFQRISLKPFGFIGPKLSLSTADPSHVSQRTSYSTATCGVALDANALIIWCVNNSSKWQRYDRS